MQCCNVNNFSLSKPFSGIWITDIHEQYNLMLANVSLGAEERAFMVINLVGC